MSAFTGDVDEKFIRGGHQRPRCAGYLSDRQRRPQMQAVYRVSSLQHPFSDHPQRSAGTDLFRRLEQETQLALELFPAAAVIGSGGKQHGGMPVVAAGMHNSVILRGILPPVLLRNSQRIHVRAQNNGFARRFSSQDPGQPVTSLASHDFNPEFY
ncbi:hypothetical protein D3C75_875260 [compost metagenome]